MSQRPDDVLNVYGCLWGISLGYHGEPHLCGGFVCRTYHSFHLVPPISPRHRYTDRYTVTKTPNVHRPEIWGAPHRRSSPGGVLSEPKHLYRDVRENPKMPGAVR